MDRTTAPNSVSGHFVDDDPGASIQGTLQTAADRNALQEEIVGTIEGAGITPAAANLGQLLAALRKGSGSTVNADLVRSTTPGARGLAYLAAADVAAIAALILADLRTVDGSGSGLDADHVRGATPGTRGMSYLSAENVTTIAALILADLLTVDGHGSSLDSDMVDGIHGASIGAARGAAGSAPDWDTLTLPGYYSCENTAGTHSPKGSGGHYGTLQVIQTGALALRQEYRDDAISGAGYFRTKYSTTAWSAWTRTFDAGNDGLNSGLEADNVPGYGIGIAQQTQLATNEQIDAISIGGIFAVDFSDSRITAPPKFASGRNRSQLLVLSQYISGAVFTKQIAFEGSYQNIAMRDRWNSGSWSSWVTIYTSATDGDGSGLDADLIDGSHAAETGASTVIKRNSGGGLPVAGYYFHDSVQNENAYFDAISPYIPNTNDAIMMNGTIFAGGTTCLAVTRAVRTSASTITLYLMNLNGSSMGYVSTAVLNDGGQTNVGKPNLAW